jgi:hypothetical protein
MKMRAIICIAMLTPVLVFGQVGGNRARSSYDPAAQADTKGQQQNGVAATLRKVNPQDKDYGAVIEQVRIAVLEQTVEDFYWWYCVVATGILFLLVMYVMWLWKEREMRLKVSADIVSQLYNSYVGARAKALDAIEAHNNLAKRYNTKLSEIVVMREASTKKEGTPAAKESMEEAEKLRTKGSKLARETTPVGTKIAGQDTSCTDNVPESELEKGLEGEDVEELKERVRQLAAQKKASEQKVANLRTQLSRAHHSLRTYRVDVPDGRPA